MGAPQRLWCTARLRATPPSGSTETAQAAAVTPDSALFLPMLLQSALLAPICEELFFRGYLMGAFAKAGRGRAIAAAALLFAAAHGVDAALAAHRGTAAAPRPRGGLWRLLRRRPA